MILKINESLEEKRKEVIVPTQIVMGKKLDTIAHALVEMEKEQND